MTVLETGQPPQPTGDVGELSDPEREQISWLRAARVGSWEITAELLAIIDRLNSRLDDMAKEVEGYRIANRALNQWVHTVKARAEAAEQALRKEGE